MQLRHQRSDDATRFVIVTERSPAASLPPPSAAANDTLRGVPLPPRSVEPRPAGLLSAIKRAAAWLLAEAIFGFAVYGATAHPCVLDPTWSPFDRDPAEPQPRILGFDASRDDFGSTGVRVTLSSEERFPSNVPCQDNATVAQYRVAVPPTSSATPQASSLAASAVAQATARAAPIEPS
jgi:hypothetical protein